MNYVIERIFGIAGYWHRRGNAECVENILSIKSLLYNNMDEMYPYEIRCIDTIGPSVSGDSDGGVVSVVDDRNELLTVIFDTAKLSSTSCSSGRRAGGRLMLTFATDSFSRMGVGARDCWDNADFFKDISIGSVVGRNFVVLLAFILELCLAVSFAFSSAATVDLAGILLLVKCDPVVDEDVATLDGIGLIDGWEK